MSIEVRDSGTDKTVQAVWARESGTDKEVQEVIVNDSGTDKAVFTASTTIGTIPDSFESWPSGITDSPPDGWSIVNTSAITNGPDRTTNSVTDGVYAMLMYVETDSSGSAADLTVKKDFNLSGTSTLTIDIDVTTIGGDNRSIEIRVLDQNGSLVNNNDIFVSSTGTQTLTLDTSNCSGTCTVRLQLTAFSFSGNLTYMEAIFDNLRGS